MILAAGFKEEELRIIGKDVFPLYRGHLDMRVSYIINNKPYVDDTAPIQGKFVIMHQLSSKEMRDTMWRIKKGVAAHVIFATTTPTSLQWTLRRLLNELLEEDRYFRRRYQ